MYELFHFTSKATLWDLHPKVESIYKDVTSHSLRVYILNFLLKDFRVVD
jgi:hypothetical protein